MVAGNLFTIIYYLTIYDLLFSHSAIYYLTIYDLTIFLFSYFTIYYFRTKKLSDTLAILNLNQLFCKRVMCMDGWQMSGVTTGDPMRQ